MTVRILCTGDMHIGRRASKVQGAYRSADAWRVIVQKAIEHQVDIVALSGDLVDKASKSYEALGPMQHGLARLGEAGIDTVAVTGNHDHDVLVRLTTITGTNRFHLLGQGGQWERFTLSRNGDFVLHVDGWSFPSEHIRQAPLHSYRAAPADGVPVMGLLHGDMGSGNSPYAPIMEQELWAAPFAFTLLGHIHVPHMFRGPEGKIALYPGSPYALDPGEPGIHGIWLAEINPSGAVSLQSIPISPVCYASIDIDLTGVTDETGFQQRLSDALQQFGEQTIRDYGSTALNTISARLRCTGECPAHPLVDSWIEPARQGLESYPVGNVVIEVDTFTSSVRPPIDLQQRAHGTDPVAEAAKIILALNEDTAAHPYSELIANTMQEMRNIYGHSGYIRLRTADDINGAPSESDARDLVRARAWEMLSLLVAQENHR